MATKIYTDRCSLEKSKQPLHIRGEEYLLAILAKIYHFLKTEENYFYRNSMLYEALRKELSIIVQPPHYQIKIEVTIRFIFSPTQFVEEQFYKTSPTVKSKAKFLTL